MALKGSNVVDDVAEDIADGGPEQRQDDDHNDSDQYKDQRILNKTLTTFFRSEQHLGHLLSLYGFAWFRSGRRRITLADIPRTSTA
jgi:hypothetical protein